MRGERTLTLMDFLEKTKGFLFSPSKTFGAIKEETLNEAIKYFVILAVIYSALTAGNLLVLGPNLYGLERTPGISSGLSANIMGMILFASYLIYSIIQVFFSGVFTHILVYLMGGRKGFSQTMKAVIYCLTPQLLLGWIPSNLIIIVILWLWSLIIDILGIRQLQEISTARVLLALILPAIISIIIAKIFLLILYAVFG